VEVADLEGPNIPFFLCRILRMRYGFNATGTLRQADGRPCTQLD
jgi:hypothetical protein